MKLIKISDTHFVITDETKPKPNDYGVAFAEGIKGVGRGWFTFHHDDSKVNKLNSICQKSYKITHSTQPLEKFAPKTLNDIGLCYVPLSDIEELIYGYSAEKIVQKQGINIDDYVGWGFIKGFNAHKELVKDKLFTVDDIEKAMDCVYSWMIPESGNLYGRFPRAGSLEELKNNFKEDHLFPKTEWEVEFVDGKLKLK